MCKGSESDTGEFPMCMNFAPPVKMGAWLMAHVCYNAD